MIHLSNYAKVHAAMVRPGGPGYKPYGIVLAEQVDGQWVTWDIHWDGEFVIDGDQGYEIWEATSGHYFQPNQGPEGPNPKMMAEFDFGLRLKRFLTDTQLNGVRT